MLHHLPDPAAGFAALRAALAPGGGMGFMVYAPYGRVGVYPLQAAFNRLYGHLPPRERLAAAQATYEQGPEGHPLRRNPNVGDHKLGDAGFYDLLVHSQDRAFAVDELLDVMAPTGWSLAQFAMPGLYDPAVLGVDAEHLAPRARMTVAEALRGTIKVHVGYARGSGDVAAMGDQATRVPHLPNASAEKLAAAVASGRVPPLKLAGTRVQVSLPRAAAPLIAAVDGRRSVGEILVATGQSMERWEAVDRALCPWGVLLYSRIFVS